MTVLDGFLESINEGLKAVGQALGLGGLLIVAVGTVAVVGGLVIVTYRGYRWLLEK